MKTLTFVSEMLELSQVARGHISLASMTNRFTSSGDFKHINILPPGNSDYVGAEPQRIRVRVDFPPECTGNVNTLMTTCIYLLLGNK